MASPEYPPALFEQHCYYAFESFKKEMIVIQHDPSLKVPLTEMFRDQGHQIITTDLNYTGMIWKDKSVMCLLNLAMDGIQCIFMPFKVKRWPQKIPSSWMPTNRLRDDIMWTNQYLAAIKEKFQNEELFGHLNLSCLRIGVRVHCFLDEAHGQAKRVKNEFGWILQFEGLRNGFCWHVNNFQSVDKCDITLIASISEKCIMTGIEIRRPQPRIPANHTADGLHLMWPFVNKADTIRAVECKIGGETMTVCILTLYQTVAGFKQVNIKTMKKVDGKDEEVDDVAWVPLKWDLDKIHELRENLIPSIPNSDMTNQLRVVQHFFRHASAMNSIQNGGTVSDALNWVA